MNKLKNVFQRSSTKVKSTEDRRPQQFVKRHSVISPMATPVEVPASPPAIHLSDLSEVEKQAYQSWWKDLDPFDLQKINNQTILKFLNGCSLPDNKLEQILALFETAGDGLNKFQFLAMLRLIAHAQNGRKISRALVYLGAPIPQFHTNAIDALIKTDLPQRQFMVGNVSPPTSMKEEAEATPPTATTTNRNSWWGNEKEESQVDHHRRSYMGPFTAHTPIPNGPLNNDTMDYFYPNNTTTTPISFNNWSEPNTTPNLLISTPKEHTHSRSKSAGTASDFIQTFHNPYHQSSEEPPLQSSRSSLSLHELNTGQSLLLTQKFVYQSPSLRHGEVVSNNPFTVSTPEKEEDIVSPFGDENSDDLMQANEKPNSLNMPPPPVPSQSNKPAFPKYTRTNSFKLNRSQSIAVDSAKHHQRHQRHKSTSATENIFY